MAKAAMHCHRNLLACHLYAEGVLGVSAEDRVFSTSRLFFAYALGNALAIPLFAGGSAYLHPAWADPAIVHDVLRSYRPTLFFSVPTVYARLLHADLPPDVFRSVRQCVSAGEKLPAEIYHAWRERFGVEILDAIGATETIFMFVSNRPRPPWATGSGSITRGAPSSATGSGRATSTCATRTVSTPTTAARTTSSRWRGNGWCRPTSRRPCSSIRPS